MYGLNSWDNLPLGTIGYAQVGRPEYNDKIKVEREVIGTFYNESETLRVPVEFHSLARFNWRLCPHDFGSYWDFEIVYDRDEIDEWEESEEEDLQEKHKRFWDWYNRCEDAISEYEELLENLCNLYYTKKVTMEVVHRTIEGLNEGLKAV